MRFHRLARAIVPAFLAFAPCLSGRAADFTCYSGAVTVPLAAPSEWQWCPLALGGGGNNLGVTFDPADANRVYSRCDVSGVIRSQDAGGHWRNVNDGFHGELQGNYSVGAIGLDPNVPGRVYAALARQFTAGGGIFRSDDYGDSWTKISDDIGLFGSGGALARGDGGAGLLVSPSDGSWLASINLDSSRGSLGVWMSWDSGVTWAPSLSGRTVNTLAWIPGATQGIMAGCVARNSYAGGMFRTTDGGTTWTPAGLGAYSVYEFAFGSPDGKTIYAALGPDGLAKTTDGGASWTLINAGLPTTAAGSAGSSHYPFEYHTVAVDPGDASHLLTANWSVNRIYTSHNGGATWTSISPSSSSVTVPAGWMMPNSNFSWHPNHIAFSPADSSKWYLSDIWGTWTTADAGLTWSIAPYGQETTCCTDIAADPAVSGKLYIGLFDHAMLAYQDSATAPSAPHPTGMVTNQPAGVNFHVSGIAQSRSGPSNLICVSNSTFVEYSTDHAASFQESTVGLPSSTARNGNVGQPIIAAATGGKAYLMLNGTPASGGGLYASSDNGVTWSHAANAGLPSVTVTSTWGALLNRFTCSPWAGVLAVASGNGDGKVYVSYDYGATWTGCTSPYPAVSVSYSNGYIVIGTQAGVYTTADHSLTVFQHPGGSLGPAGSIETLTVDPGNPARWLAHSIVGTGADGSPIDYGLWLTEDGGAHWTRIENSTLAIWRLRGLSFDPANPGRIYANTYWGGSWMASRPTSP